MSEFSSYALIFVSWKYLEYSYPWCTVILLPPQVETSDHARLKVEYAMNNYFDVCDLVLCWQCAVHYHGNIYLYHSTRTVTQASCSQYRTSSDLLAERLVSITTTISLIDCHAGFRKILAWTKLAWVSYGWANVFLTAPAMFKIGNLTVF